MLITFMKEIKSRISGTNYNVHSSSRGMLNIVEATGFTQLIAITQAYATRFKYMDKSYDSAHTELYNDTMVLINAYESTYPVQLLLIDDLACLVKSTYELSTTEHGKSEVGDIYTVTDGIISAAYKSIKFDSELHSQSDPSSDGTIALCAIIDHLTDLIVCDRTSDIETWIPVLKATNKSIKSVKVKDLESKRIKKVIVKTLKYIAKAGTDKEYLRMPTIYQLRRYCLTATLINKR